MTITLELLQKTTELEKETGDNYSYYLKNITEEELKEVQRMIRYDERLWNYVKFQYWLGQCTAYTAVNDMIENIIDDATPKENEK